MIRRLHERDVQAVHALYAACHPTWPAKPETYWWAHPTLVLLEGRRVIGASSFSLCSPPSPDLLHLSRNRPEVGWGHGVYVHPDHRGQGHGWQLAHARHVALKDLGVDFFFGMTQPENHAMLAIFKRQQLARGATIPKAYPDGQDGVLHHGGIV